MEEGEPGSRNGVCLTVVFSWDGNTDLFYGYIQTADGTSDEALYKSKAGGNVCLSYRGEFSR